ncbi:MAG: outer membrane protein assembly factor BamD [Pyrinomonadaceae bacterium]|nr:outer membrane protein assembly factor BamD [Phycisphaerales bacterium]
MSAPDGLDATAGAGRGERVMRDGCDEYRYRFRDCNAGFYATLGSAGVDCTQNPAKVSTGCYCVSMQARSFRTHRRILVVMLLAVAGARASAQSTEYKLDPGGEWQQTAAPAAGSDEAVIAQARRALADKKPERTIAILNPWIEKNENTENPLLAHAYLLRADAKTVNGDEYKALYDYDQGVIARFPASPLYVTALERELEIAIRYVNGLRYKWLGMRIFDARDIGEELLIRVQERLPGSRLAERAGIELADYYYREHDLSSAGQAYELFLRNYPTSVYRMKAMQRRVESAVGQFKGPEYDTSSLKDAKVLIGRFASLYPTEANKAGLNDGLVARIDESAAAELLVSAKWYIKQDDLVSARHTLRRLVNKHGGTAAATVGAQMLEDRGWLKTPVKADAKIEKKVEQPTLGGTVPSNAAEEKGSSK